MTHDFEAAYKVLYDHQQWRMGNDDYPPTEPKELSAAMEVAFKALRLAAKVQAMEVIVVPYCLPTDEDLDYNTKMQIRGILAKCADYDWTIDDNAN